MVSATVRSSNRATWVWTRPRAMYLSCVMLTREGPQMVRADPRRQLLVINQRRHRLAETMTHGVRHAEHLPHLAPAGTEVIRVARRASSRRESHRLHRGKGDCAEPIGRSPRKWAAATTACPRSSSSRRPATDPYPLPEPPCRSPSASQQMTCWPASPTSRRADRPETSVRGQHRREVPSTSQRFCANALEPSDELFGCYQTSVTLSDRREANGAGNM